MADTNANIRIDVDTSEALAQIKRLQREISLFHSSMAKGGAAAAAASSKLQASLTNTINSTRGFSAEMVRINSTAESFTNALEKNKLSMGQYFRYAGASTKTFGKLFKTEFNTIEKVARERVKDLQTQYIKMGRDASGALQALKVRPLTLDMQNLGTQTAMAAQKVQIFNQLVQQGSTNLLNWGKNTQWAGRQLMVGFTLPLSLMGTVAAKEFMKLEKQAIRFRRVYGEMFTTSSETEKAIQQVRDLAEEFTKYGVAAEKTMALAADAAQMGLMGSALTAQVTEATRLAVLGEVEQQAALETTISVTNAFGVAAEDLASKIDFLNAVENQTMVAISDLTEAIPKAGPVVKQLGGDVEDLAFFLAAMREGGINASESANALKSGLASMINPTQKASEMLAGFGINLKGIVDANAGDIKSTVVQFAEALNELDPLNRARAIEELFGKFQFARISTLFQNITKEGSQASRVLQLTQQSAEELAVLSERELSKVEDSPVFKFEKAIERIQMQLAPLGESFLKAVTPLIEFGTKILEKFNSLSDGTKQFIVTVAGIGGVIAPVLLMTIGLIANGAANFIKFIQLVGRYFGLAGGASNTLGEQTNYLTQEQLEQLSVAASLDQVHQSLVQTFTSEAGAINALTAAYQAAIVAQGNYAASSGAASAASGAAAAAGGAAAATGGTSRYNPFLAPGYANGILSVPGPKGAGDVVPSMLSPGEAVIPAALAKKYGPLVQGIIADNIPGFAEGGIVEVGGQQIPVASAVAARSITTRMETLRGRTTASGQYDDAFFMEALKKLAGQAIETGEALAITGRQFEEATRDLAEEKDMLAPARAHVTRGFGADDPRAKAAMEKIGWDKLPDKYKENLSFVSNLTAELGQASNLRLRGGNETVQGFQQEWFGRQDKMLAAAEAGGLDTANQENIEALRMLENEIGNRVVATAEATGQQTLHDDDVADATMSVIAQYENLEGAVGEVARAWRVRAEQVGEIRSSQGRELIEQGLQPGGDLQQRGSQIDYVDPNTGEVVKGIARMPKDKDSSVYASRDVPGNKGGAYGNTERRSSKVEQLVEQDALDDANARNKVIEANTQDIYVASRDRSSPHPLAEQDGIDDQNAYNKGRQAAGGPLAPPTAPDTSGYKPSVGEQAMNKFGDSKFGQFLGRGVSKLSGNALTDSQGNVTYDPSKDESTWAGRAAAEEALAEQQRQATIAAEREAAALAEATAAKQANTAAEEASTAATHKNTDAEQRQTQQENSDAAAATPKKGGGLAGGLFMAGSVAMGASMMGGPIGEFAGKVAGPLMAIGGIMPMLGKMPPMIQGVIVVLGLLAYAGYKVWDAFKQAAKRTLELEDALGRSRKAMDKFAEFTGKVTSSEIMDRRRASGIDPFQVAPGKTTIGENFFGGEAGQEMLTNVKAGILQFGKDATINKVFMQLGQAVASGALDTASAMSIASELGAQLEDLSFSIGVRSKLMELIDPTGTDLLINPIELQAKINMLGQEDLEALIMEGPKTMAESYDEGFQMVANSWEAYGLGAIFRGEFWEGFFRGDMLTGWFFNQTDNIARMAEIIGAANNQLESLGAELDTIDVEFSKKIEDAISSGDSLQYINDLRQQQLDATEQALLKREQALRTTMSERATDPGKFDMALKQSLGQMFAGEELTAANKLFDRIDNVIENPIQSAEFQLLMSTGDISLGTITEILDDWDSRPDYAEKRLELATNFGKGITQEIDAIIQAIDDPALEEQYIAILDPNNLQATTEAMDAVTAAARVANASFGDIGDSIIGAVVSDPGVRAQINRDLQTLETIDATMLNISDEKNVQFVIDTFGEEAFNIAKAMWDQVAPGEEKQAFYSILTMLDLETTPEYDQWLQNQRGNKVAGVDIRDDVSGRAALVSRSLQEARAASASVVDDMEEAASGGGGKLSSVLDDIVKKLRDVRMNQIIMTNGWVESANKLEELFGGGKDISIFSGIEQDMRRLGAGEDLISLIAGMDPDEFERKKDQLFTFDAAGEITGVTNILANLGKAMKAVAMGDFQSEQEKTIRTINDQIIAIRKLTAAGLSQAAAYEMVQNAAMASAIAQEQNIDVIRQLIRVTQQAKEMSEAFAAAQAVANKNQEFADRKKALSFVQRNMANLTDAQREAVLSDPNLQALIGTNIDPKALRQALANAEAEADLELEIKKMTFEGQIEIFQEGFSKAMQAFAAQEQKIELDFQIKKQPLIDAIEAAEQQIADIRDRPGGLDDLEADIERIANKESDINDAYDKRIEALDQVSKINSDIAKQQQEQLDVADALSRGDIAAAAKAVQQARQNEATRATERQKEALNTQREYELAKLTGNMGLTREQLEKNIKALKQEIFDIEENTIEPAQYRVDLLDREQQTLVDSLTVLGKSRDEWERIKNGIDLAEVSSQKFQDSIQEALNMVESITTYWDDFDPDPKEIKLTPVVTVPVEELIPSAFVTPRETGGGGGSGGGDATSAAPNDSGLVTGDTGGGGRGSGSVLGSISTPIRPDYTIAQVEQAERAQLEAARLAEEAAAELERINGTFFINPLTGKAGFGLEFAGETTKANLAALQQQASDAHRVSQDLMKNIRIQYREALDENASQIFSAGAPDLATAMTTLMDELQNNAEGVIANNIPGYFRDLGVQIPTLLQGIPNFFANMDETSRDVIQGKIVGHLQGMATRASEFLFQVPNFLNSIPQQTQDAILNRIPENFRVAGQKITQEDLASISEWFHLLPADVQQLIEGDISGYFTNLATSAESDLDGTLGEWFHLLPPSVVDLVEGEIQDSFVNMADGAEMKLEDYIGQWFNDLPDEVKGPIEQQLAGAFGNLAQNARDNMDPLVRHLLGLPDRVRLSAEEAQRQVVAAATTANGEIVGSADALERRILTAMGNTEDVIGSALADGAETGTDAAGTEIETIEETVAGLDIAGQFTTHGTNSGTNFKTAMTNSLKNYNPSFTVTRYVNTVYLPNQGGMPGAPGFGPSKFQFNSGGFAMAKYAIGGRVNSMPMNGVIPGTADYDKINALLTPGEFIIRKEAVQKYGRGLFEALNRGIYKPSSFSSPTYSTTSFNTSTGPAKDANSGGVMYNNYSVSVNVTSESNPDQIAKTVIDQIKRVDSQRIRSNRF